MDYTPPEAFGIVEPGVYRSNIPYAVNFPFLRQLGLHTVVLLSPERPVREITDFFEQNNVEMIHVGHRTWATSSSWRPVSEEIIKEGLQLVLDVNRHPIMVMCTLGIHQTGTLVGCLRKLQEWNLTSILNEYHMFAREKSRYINEQFIEIFDLDLVTLPRDLPPWFIEQKRMLEEEEREYAKQRSTAPARPLAAPDPIGPDNG